MHTMTLQTWLFWLMVFGSGVVGLLLGISLAFRNVEHTTSSNKVFLFTCYLVLSEGSPVYRSYLVNVPGESPSAKDLKTFCDSVKKNSNHEITDCIILSINPLRD